MAGVAVTAVALGVAELAAGLLAGAASPVVAVGDAVVDRVPAWLKNLAIAVFGVNDKVALLVGIAVVSAAAGGAAGAVARRRPWVPVVLLVAAGGIGVAAASQDPQATAVSSAIAVGAGVVAGLAALATLLRGDRGASPAADDHPPVSRRRFLAGVTAAVGLAAAFAVAGRALTTASAAARSRLGLVIPRPRRPAPALPAGADLEIAGADPFTTPTTDFYRIDTALSVPRVDVATWRLRVTGMVNRPLELTFDDLVGRGLTEHWTTLCCVSNEVGGRLIGNALWGGVPLREVLDLAGVHVGASQIVGRSVDGWTAGFPTEVAYDGRTALIAVTMNGEPLPTEHGFPARLVVPGLYGYVSATKWLSEIELTTVDAFDAYWVPRGWAKQAPVKTQSRIDVPRAGRVVSGRVVVAGVAWAQQRGVERVEVQVDDGPWHEARLAAVPHVDTWRQWVWEWDAEPGSHVLQVRATDGDGEVQTAQRSPVMPDGATGYHRVLVQVQQA